MTIENAHDNLIKSLTPIFEKGEATQMARIVFEDAFSITNFSRQDELTEHQIEKLKEIQKRLLAKEPIQYIVGMTYFYDLKFKVGSAVLIPRPETEELVHWILEDQPKDLNLRILDIGTGSGCIPITLKSKAPNFQVAAIDVSSAALSLAEENGTLNQVEVDFINLDILKKENWQTLPSYEVIVSNPPYIPFSEKELMSTNVLDHEPEIALFVTNEDPLIFYRTIIEFGKEHLVNGGWLYFETNEYNATEVEALFFKAGFFDIEKQKDLQGKERMVKARFGTRNT